MINFNEVQPYNITSKESRIKNYRDVQLEYKYNNIMLFDETLHKIYVLNLLDKTITSIPAYKEPEILQYYFLNENYTYFENKEFENITKTCRRLYKKYYRDLENFKFPDTTLGKVLYEIVDKKTFDVSLSTFNDLKVIALY